MGTVGIGVMSAASICRRSHGCHSQTAAVAPGVGIAVDRMEQDWLTQGGGRSHSPGAEHCIDHSSVGHLMGVTREELVVTIHKMAAVDRRHSSQKSTKSSFDGCLAGAALGDTRFESCETGFRNNLERTLCKLAVETEVVNGRCMRECFLLKVHLVSMTYLLPYIFVYTSIWAAWASTKDPGQHTAVTGTRLWLSRGLELHLLPNSV